jgi:hypothetical protein
VPLSTEVKRVTAEVRGTTEDAAFAADMRESRGKYIAIAREAQERRQMHRMRLAIPPYQYADRCV